MSDEKVEAPKLMFIDNPHAMEVFANHAAHFSIVNGVVVVTFTSQRNSQEDGKTVFRSVVSSRLVMPIAGAQDLAAGLYDFLKTNNLDPAPLPDGAYRQ